MSPDAVIRAESLGKKYVISHESEPERYTALRDVISRNARGMVRRGSDLLRGRPIFAGNNSEEFWALSDVNFEIKRGEVVGIIGRNGAGKSTLLKILSRITEPSAGRVSIRGRVASLLEVGTGFHPELTGRENIYLNGAILGMKRAEIRRKFNEIVDFSGVEKFIDTPVKRYSSGMYVRLAFAVAAHLEPEILVVDEILAVGDAEFQKKCLGKMQDVAGHGRTVLFVSHNMAAVESLCDQTILLADGQIRASGKHGEVVQLYLSSAVQTGNYHDLTAIKDRMGNGELLFEEVGIWGERQGELPITGGTLNIWLRFGGNASDAKPSRVSVAIHTAAGAPLIVCSTEMTESVAPMIASGETRICCIPSLPLTAGAYLLTLFVEQQGVVQDWLTCACKFEVHDADFYGHGRNVPVGYKEGLTVLVDHCWRAADTVRSRLENHIHV